MDALTDLRGHGSQEERPSSKIDILGPLDKSIDQLIHNSGRSRFEIIPIQQFKPPKSVGDAATRTNR